jgi:cytochrome c peroxidase
LTAPYFHNGSAENLTAAIRQHVQPRQSMKQFDWYRLPWELRQISRPHEIDQQQLLATRDSILREEIKLDASDIKDLVAFLQALTDPRAETLQQWQPETVPSGLRLPAEMPSPEGHKGVH